MNPKQLGLMMQPGSGRIFIVLNKPKATAALKDVTTDFTLMLAAEILKEEAEGVERVYEAADIYGNVMEVEVTAKIVSKRGPEITPN